MHPHLTPLQLYPASVSNFRLKRFADSRTLSPSSKARFMSFQLTASSSYQKEMETPPRSQIIIHLSFLGYFWIL